MLYSADMTSGPQTQSHHHAVKFYSTDESLFATVTAFVAEGLSAGQPGVVIATPAHCQAVLTELARRLIDVPHARRIGDLVCMDAEETLETFMHGDLPDREAFKRHVGDAIEQTLAGRTRTPVRAYGEMVDILWKRGRTEAAIRLEILWNELAETHAFQLLCGYSIGNFYKQIDHFEAVCQQHTAVIADAADLPSERRSSARSA